MHSDSKNPLTCRYWCMTQHWGPLTSFWQLLSGSSITSSSDITNLTAFLSIVAMSPISQKEAFQMQEWFIEWAVLQCPQKLPALFPGCFLECSWHFLCWGLEKTLHKVMGMMPPPHRARGRGEHFNLQMTPKAIIKPWHVVIGLVMWHTTQQIRTEMHISTKPYCPHSFFDQQFISLLHVSRDGFNVEMFHIDVDYLTAHYILKVACTTLNIILVKKKEKRKKKYWWNHVP